MFPVVFLFLAFGVLVTFLVGLAMFIEVAFSPDLPIVRQKATNEGRERFAKRQQAAVNGPLPPVGRAALVSKSSLVAATRVRHRFGARHHV